MKSRRPNVLLIVYDSARAENLSIYGYPRTTSPYLEELSPDAAVYTNAISTAASTVPAHASIFTGTFVYTNKLFVDGRRLSGEYGTLAEALTDVGYRTFGICYQDDVSPLTGLDRGFRIFDKDDSPGPGKMLLRSIFHVRHAKKSPPTPQVTGGPGVATDELTKAFDAPKRSAKDGDLFKRLYWHATRFSDQGAASSHKKVERFLDSAQGDHPFFIYLHYDETHLPYRPPVPHRHRFFEGISNSKKPWRVNQLRNEFFLNRVDMTREDFEILRNLYDGAISYLDERTRALLGILKARRLHDDTMIIIMGDHGDNIGEHQLMSHKWCLYDTLIRVPLVIKYPRDMGLKGRFDTIVQHTDIVPTILDVLGIDDHRIVGQIEGNSLVPGTIRKRRDESYAISEQFKPFGPDMSEHRELLKRYDRRLLSLRTRNYKYIWASDGRDEFYDISRDPGENENLIESGMAEVGALRRLIEPHIARHNSCYETTKHLF